MRRKISVDTQLVDSAVLLGQHRSKTEAATAALEQYVQRLKQCAIEAPGKVDYDTGDSRGKPPGDST